MPNQSPPESFAWISYATELDAAYITVDSQKRLYLSSAAAKLLGLTLPTSLIIGHDHANKRLIVAKPDIVRAANVKPHKFDGRRYCSAKPFIRALAIDDADLPQRYEYLGKDYGEYPQGAYTFGLAEYKAPDGGIEPE